MKNNDSINTLGQTNTCKYINDNIFQRVLAVSFQILDLTSAWPSYI